MLRIVTLGGLSAEASDRPSEGALREQLSLALLALLAVAGERGVSRDKLRAYLWPEADDDRAGRALAARVRGLCEALDAPVVVADGRELRLDPAHAQADVAEFEDALDRRDLLKAVALHAGPFADRFTLSGCPEFRRWAETERGRLEQRYRGALESLASDAMSVGDFRGAAHWWQRLAVIDPLSTHVALSLMNALAAAGDRPGAIAHAERHEALLRAEYRTQPNAAVLALAAKLRATPDGGEGAAESAVDRQPRRSSQRISRGVPRVADTEMETIDPSQLRSSRERGVVIGGRYLIQRELGRGGMATVCLARDLKHDREVALKFVHAELADALGKERFEREIAVLAKLHHPHILPLYDSGEVEGALYYVMPYLAGETLRERLVRQTQLPVSEALRIGREVADALAYAHAHDVIHRDIKPENIILADGHAQLTDFGIARAVSRAAGRRLTDDGFAVGTPAYMSPEQASGDPLDGRSDQYSLACVIYEMLAGQPPFTGLNGRTILSQRFTSPPMPVRRVRDTVPIPVDAALTRALSRIPADRFPTITEFADSLGAEPPPGPEAPPRRRPWGRWLWVALAAAAVGVVAAIFAFRPAPVDPNLFVVIPFVHRQGAAPSLLNGDNCQQLLYESFGRWDGIKLVDHLRTTDQLSRHPTSTLTFDQAMRAARSLRAGRLAWGEVWQIDSSIQVRGSLYDVARGRSVREYSVTIRADLSDAPQRFAELADSLLVPTAGPPTAGAGVRGTKVLAALTDYMAGHEELSRWSLDSAAASFRAAATADPAYASAHYWLAQVMTWGASHTDAEWRAAATAAAARSGALARIDSILAGAQLRLATGDYGSACEEYTRALAADSLSFAAWYGLGECRRQDDAVVRMGGAPAAPRWAFRSSYQQALTAYERALELLPSVHLAFADAFSRLTTLLFAESNVFRRGVALEPDTLLFGAFPSWDHDTLAFAPVPLAELAAGAANSVPATQAAAVAHGRQDLLRISQSWVRAFPQSAAAHETVARALELADQMGGSGNQPPALDEMMRARALAASASDKLRAGSGAVRLLLKQAQFARAADLADTLLSAPESPAGTDAQRLAALAALRGRIHRAATLLRLASAEHVPTTPDGRELTVPTALKEPASALLVYSLFGLPADSIATLHTLIEARAPSYLNGRQLADARDALLVEPATFAFLDLGRAPLGWSTDTLNRYLRLERGLARGDTARVRAQILQDNALNAKLYRAGDITPDAIYRDTRLLVLCADSAAAREQLDLALNALPTLNTYVLEEVPLTVSFVRMMGERAEIAGRSADAPLARLWGSAVVTLWTGSDPELKPTVEHLRLLSSPAR